MKSMKEIIKKVIEEFKISKDEAELIIATLLEQPRFGIYINNEIEPESATILKMKLNLLKQGMPIEYITQKVQFMDYLLNIYPGVFIPRIETEYFVELISRLVATPKKILEIGTGCGAIAISLAKVFPDADIIATDISQTALNNALENIKQFNLSERITLVQGDLFRPISTKFDLIVSNPPYIPNSRLKFLPKSVKDFEPILAIDGGEQGVQFIKMLIQQGMQFLKPYGAMAIEIDEDEVEVLKSFSVANLLNSFAFKKDLFGRFRYFFIGDFRDEKSKDCN